MTHIPSAAPPREVTGGAQATPNTAESTSSFNATLEASLLAVLSSTTRSFGQPVNDAAQHLRPKTDVAAHHEAGKTRLATISELASAELATSTYQPPQHAPQAPQAAPAQRAATDAQPQARTASQQTPPQQQAQQGARPHQPAQPRSAAPTVETTVTPVAPRSQADAAASVATAQRIAAAPQLIAPPPAAAPRTVTGVAPNLTSATRIAAPTRAAPMQGTTQPAKTAPPAHVLRHAEAFQAQLAKGLAAALKREGSSITLNLRPRSLGRLTIELTVRGHDVTARVQATTESARSLLESASVELRESMAARGLTLQRLDVEIGESSDESPVHDQHQDASEKQPEPRSHDPAERTLMDDAEPLAPDEDVHVVELGLDVTV